jgi:hypothetical protein
LCFAIFGMGSAPVLSSVAAGATLATAGLCVRSRSKALKKKLALEAGIQTHIEKIMLSALSLKNAADTIGEKEDVPLSSLPNTRPEFRTFNMRLAGVAEAMVVRGYSDALGLKKPKRFSVVELPDGYDFRVAGLYETKSVLGLAEGERMVASGQAVFKLDDPLHPSVSLNGHDLRFPSSENGVISIWGNKYPISETSGLESAARIIGDKLGKKIPVAVDTSLPIVER